MFIQSGGSLNVTGAVGDWFSLQYEYTATHAPVPVEAGACYWVSIANPTSCDWGWRSSHEGNDRLLRDGLPLDGWGPEDEIPDDLAFCLDVPLADSAACLVEPCPWDCDGSGDGIVGIQDFLDLLAQWMQTGVPCDSDGGGVGITDFLDLLANWGPCP